MNKDKLDYAISRMLKTESEQIIGLKDIAVPSIDESITKLVSNLESGIKVKEPQYFSKRKKGSSLVRKFVTAASILLLSFILTFLYEIPQVNAFKFDVIKTLISIKDSIISITHIDKDNNTIPQPSGDDAIVRLLTPEQAEEELPFHLLLPDYLPQGYNLKGIESYTYPNKIQRVEQTYRKDGNEFLIILQTTNIQNENMTIYADSKYNKVSTLKIDEVEVTLIDSTDSRQAIWYNNGAKFNITTTLTNDEIKSIIKGLK